MSKNLTEKITDNLTNGIDLVLKPMKERMSNILTGSFVLAEIAINWRMILYLFKSPTNLAETFTYIDTHLYPTFWSKFLMFFVLPAFITLIYGYIIPVLTEGIEKKTDVFKKSKQERSQEKVELFLKHNITAMDLLAQAERKKTNFDEVRQFTDEIDRLNTEIGIRNNKIENQNKLLTEESSKLTNLMERQYNLSSEKDLSDLALRSVLNYIINNGKASGRELIDLINDVYAGNRKIANDIITLIKKRTEIEYRITAILTEQDKNAEIFKIQNELSMIFDLKDDYDIAGNIFSTIVTLDISNDVEQIRGSLGQMLPKNEITLEKIS